MWYCCGEIVGRDGRQEKVAGFVDGGVHYGEKRASDGQLRLEADVVWWWEEYSGLCQIQSGFETL
jgi:hypothetical protein